MLGVFWLFALIVNVFSRDSTLKLGIDIVMSERGSQSQVGQTDTVMNVTGHSDD